MYLLFHYISPLPILFSSLAVLYNCVSIISTYFHTYWHQCMPIVSLHRIDRKYANWIPILVINYSNMQRNFFHIVLRIIRITFRSRKTEYYERNWTIAKNGNARLRLSPRAVVLSRFSNEFKFRIIVPISNLFDNQKNKRRAIVFN